MKSVILLGPIDGQFTDYVPLKCPITIRRLANSQMYLDISQMYLDIST